MRWFSLLVTLFICTFCCAAEISLKNWTISSKSKGCSVRFENNNLIVKTGKSSWSISNNNRNQAVPGKAVKIDVTLELLPPARAMIFFELYEVKNAKRSDVPFHTMKIADYPGFSRKYTQTANIPEGVTEFEMKLSGRAGASFAVSSLSTTIVPAIPVPMVKARGKYQPLTPKSAKRHRECLDRGAVAFERSNGVYISWRLLETDAADTAFDIYRDGKKITSSPITDTTDFFDPVKGKQYCVKPVNSRAVSGYANVQKEVKGTISPCRVLRLANKKARASKVGIGDLDGDGVYDYVVKYSPSHVDPWYTAYFAPEGTCKLEAINGKSGKVMWKKDLGWSIETGVWYSPYIVYDFNGDGKAEVVLKTGVGDPRDPDGKVTSGEEYLTVCDGVSGKELARAPWPSREGFLNLDIPYNFYSRNQMAVAYLDGKTPYIIVMRGTYSLMLVEAWSFNGRKLENAWKYSSAGYAKEFQGQGAHSTRCCDIDDDGRDEVVLGNMVLDDDGLPLWSNGRRHPDFIYVADLIPEREGLESATCLEINNTKGGLNVSCAKTGKCIWELKEPHFHIHYGFCGDIDPLYRGVLIGGTDVGAGNKKYPANAWIFTGSGKMLSRGVKTQFFNESPFFAYWDGDLRREYVKKFLKKYNGGEVGGMVEGAFLTTADVYGDWREEILTSAEGELRIYSTDIPAMDRRTTLMQDDFYRMAVATASCGYHYDPMPKILPSTLATDVVLTLKKPDTLQITVTAPMKKEVKGKLALKLPDGLSSDFSSSDIALPPGGIWNKTVKLTGKNIGKCQPIYADLQLADGKKLTARTLSGRPEVPDLKVKLYGYWVGAENVYKQSGGKVLIRKWPGIHNKCIYNWGKPGHKVVWQLKLPKSGKYKIHFRYATKRNSVYRTLDINGKDYGKIRFLPTGAMGKSALDWSWYSPDITLDLKAGVQTISMQCVSGAMSLDAISFTYCK